MTLTVPLLVLLCQWTSGLDHDMTLYVLGRPHASRLSPASIRYRNLDVYALARARAIDLEIVLVTAATALDIAIAYLSSPQLPRSTMLLPLHLPRSCHARDNALAIALAALDVALETALAAALLSILTLACLLALCPAPLPCAPT